MVFSPVQQLSQVFDGYQQAAVGLQRIKGLLRLRTSTPEPVSPVPVPDGGLAGRIELRNVRFSYGSGAALSGLGADGADAAVLDTAAVLDASAVLNTAGEAFSGVSLTVAPGE